ncbi:hypothetical protein [Thermococcus chitonophagus]
MMLRPQGRLELNAIRKYLKDMI